MDHATEVTWECSPRENAHWSLLPISQSILESVKNWYQFLPEEIDYNQRKHHLMRCQSLKEYLLVLLTFIFVASEEKRSQIKTVVFSPNLPEVELTSDGPTGFIDYVQAKIQLVIEQARNDMLEKKDSPAQETMRKICRSGIHLSFLEVTLELSGPNPDNLSQWCHFERKDKK